MKTCRRISMTMKKRRIWNQRHLLSTAIALNIGLVSCQESMEDRAAREAREYTEKHCPAPVYKDVVMDSMTFDKATHTFSYYYTLSGVLDDTTYINNSHPYENLLKEVRNSTHLKIYKEAAYSFRYVYYSQKNRGTKHFDATYHESDYR